MVPLLQTVQEGHQNSVCLRSQFHAILSGVLPTADPRSSAGPLTVSCSSAVFRDVSCSKAAADAPNPRFSHQSPRMSQNWTMNTLGAIADEKLEEVAGHSRLPIHPLTHSFTHLRHSERGMLRRGTKTSCFPNPGGFQCLLFST